MKQYILSAASILLCTQMFTAAALTACSDEEHDMTYPTISGGDDFNPVNCQNYHPGDTIAFRAIFSDNEALGNYNIEVHSNFDHHSHSTEADADGHEEYDCDEDDEQHAEPDTEHQAWIYNQSFSIPAGQVRYNASVDIAIPTDIACGLYHFMVRLTDNAGWQQLKSVSIRIS